MAFKRNIVASYASQIYSTLISLAIIPLYIKYMGKEAYGLVGFYAMLQTWLQILDMGLSPTISRETARYNGGALSPAGLLDLFRSFRIVFLVVALCSTAIVVLASGVITDHWLTVEVLSASEVSSSIKLMGVTIGLRWLSSLYRGALTGFEMQVRLAQIDIAIATARNLLVFLVFWKIGTTPTDFFTYQAAVALLETALLSIQTHQLLPRIDTAVTNGQVAASLRRVMGFALSIASTNAAWVFVTQSDKLILSKLLSLSDFAQFTLAVILANGITIITSPVGGALIPRLSRLHARGQEAELISVYRQSTQFVTAIAASASLFLACFPKEIVLIWTHSEATATFVSPILRLYAIGSGFLALTAFPYYLQFAKGKLRLHVIGNIVFIAVFLPLVAMLCYRFGAIGAGAAWAIANMAYFLLWTPLIHKELAPSLHASWLVRDIAPPVLAPLLVALVIRQYWQVPASRLEALAMLCAIGLLLAGSALATTRLARQKMSAMRNLLWKTTS